MSFIVRGMEMPGSCIQCFFCSYNGKESFCFALRKPVIPLTDTLPDVCPLIPVPPHGRLIDADALSEKMVICSKHIPNDSFEWDLCGEVITQLALAPTIIEAEEGE